MQKMKKQQYVSPAAEIIELAVREGVLAASQTDTGGLLGPLDGSLGDFDWESVNSLTMGGGLL